LSGAKRTAFSTPDASIFPRSSLGEQETFAQLPNLPTWARASMTFVGAEVFDLRSSSYSGGI
jgi:hypothetical protein